MPTLDWIGKSKVVNHHLDVPYCVLDRKYSFDENGYLEEDNGSDNMVIHGDNLIALKSLLPQYENGIDCIYIDPPYNTGKKEGQWIYSDNVDDPIIKKWIGEVVGAEGDDLSRHDKWLCMMYPRLRLLHRCLSKRGVIFISIDDNELASLKIICDEIFGSSNYIGILSVEINPKGRKNSAFVSQSNDYCLIYAKHKLDVAFIENIPKDKKDLAIDENGRLVHNSGKRVLVGENSFNNVVSDFKSKKHYSVYYNEDNGDFVTIKEESIDAVNVELINAGYKRYISSNEGVFVENTYSEDKILELFEEDALDFKNKKIYEKNFSTKIRIKSIVTNKKYKTYDEEGNVIDYQIDVKTTSAGTELKNIFKTDKTVFPNPKNRFFISLLISLLNYENMVVLDSFAGSGTTAHAILDLNKNSKKSNRFILIEMGEYADTITAERIKRVIAGYKSKKKFVEGIGGNFSYYELGEPLMKDGLLNETVGEDKICEYVYFTETKQKISHGNEDEPYFLGQYAGNAYYFYYHKDSLTTLDREFLHTVKRKSEGYVIYADLCTLSTRELERYHITFKKIPRDISRL